MARFSPLMLLPPVLFAALAVTFYMGMTRDDPQALPSAIAGKPAPHVELTPLGDFTSFTDADLRAGDVVLVNYWASWCAPCRAEHPNLVKLAERGVPIYGINYKDKPENALGFLAELGNPFARLGADATGRTAIDWGLYGVPETYVIAGDGTVMLRFAGPITTRVMEEKILPAIDKARAR